MTEIFAGSGSVSTILPGSSVVGHPAWTTLKTGVTELRGWQRPDGSIDFDAAPTFARVRESSPVPR